MPSSRRQMNWDAVALGTQTFTGVTQVQISRNGSIKKFSGDMDRYPTTVVNDFADPNITITCADQGAALSLAVGARGTFTATHADAKNLVATGGGAIVYTALAVVQDVNVGGAHRDFGMATITLCTEAIDGQTNPVSIAAL